VPRLADSFIEAASKTGWPEIKDLQNQNAINGVQRSLHYICPQGKRQDAASRYLHPRLQDGSHTNLHVVVETQVVRVLVENDRAIGIELRPKTQSGSLDSHRTRIIRARKMVILSCGAFGTPAGLERSGVGNPEILKRAQVPLVAALPGVGHDYLDHQLLLTGYKSDLAPDETFDAIHDGRRDLEMLVSTNDKILGWNGVDITSKLRPTDVDVAALGPEFQKAWDRDFKNNPTRPLTLMFLLSR
jgi:alcohol oxidase